MEEYRIVLESQLGPRAGVLRLEQERRGVVTGAIVLLGAENAARGRWLDTGVLWLAHRLRTWAGELECVSVFTFEGGRLLGTLKNGKNTMRWHGEKLHHVKREDDEDGRG